MFGKVLAVAAMSLVCITGPTLGQESPPNSKRIAWRTSVLDAFVEAVENNKPLVVVFLANPSYRPESGDNLSNREWAELDELVVHELADEAVFAVAQFDQRLGRVADEYGHRMFFHLKLTALPTISVIAPRTDALTELRRLEGFFPAGDVVSDLTNCFKRYAAAQLISRASAPADSSVPASPALEINPYEPQTE
ncbi:MAG: hypothetical protein U0795_26345 [Pirellulales bacterium]